MLQWIEVNIAVAPNCAITSGHGHHQETIDWLQKSLIVDNTTSFLILCCVEFLEDDIGKEVAVIIGLY